MTLEQAHGWIGRKVEYRQLVHLGIGGVDVDVEEGVITSVNDHHVFVRFGVEGFGVACNPADLELAE